jgi:hypothetical protein
MQHCDKLNYKNKMDITATEAGMQLAGCCFKNRPQ